MGPMQHCVLILLCEGDILSSVILVKINEFVRYQKLMKAESSRKNPISKVLSCFSKGFCSAKNISLISSVNKDVLFPPKAEEDSHFFCSVCTHRGAIKASCQMQIALLLCFLQLNYMKIILVSANMTEIPSSSSG